MLILKILLQVCVGTSALLALLLDYKWHDKRKKAFRRGRNILYTLSVFSLIGGIIITVTDEKDKDQEIKKLTNQLEFVNRRLVIIKQNGDKLNLQIEPFLKIATDRYPGISSEEALDSLKSHIENIRTKTLNLESAELERKLKETGDQELKNKPPFIKALLKMDDERNVFIGINFFNNVPIKFSYTLEHFQNNKLLNSNSSGGFELYPIKGKNPFFSKCDFNFRDHIPNNAPSQMRITIFYQSLYYMESLNPTLKDVTSTTYIVNPHINTLTEE